MKHLLGLMVPFLLAPPASALACSDPQEPTFVQEIARAKNVFIFRLVSLRLTNHSPESHSIVGDVEIVRSLKGRAVVRKISFTDQRCGGMRPLVGHYYAAVTRQEGAVLRLVRGDNSIIDISDDYANTYPPRKESQKWQWHIANYVRGIPLPPRFIRSSAYLAAHSAPPPAEEP